MGVLINKFNLLLELPNRFLKYSLTANIRLAFRALVRLAVLYVAACSPSSPVLKGSTGYYLTIESLPGDVPYNTARVNSLSLAADNAGTILYAKLRYRTDLSYAGDVNVDWEITGTGADIGEFNPSDPTPTQAKGSSATYIPNDVGQYKITATHDGYGPVTIDPVAVTIGALTQYKIKYGAIDGNELASGLTFNVDESLKLYAVGVDNKGNEEPTPVSANWSVSSAVGTFWTDAALTIPAVNPVGQGYVYFEATAAGAATISIDVNGDATTEATTASITIAANETEKIVIETVAGGGGSAIGAVTYTAGVPEDLYAVGRLNDDTYKNNAPSNWIFTTGGTATGAFTLDENVSAAEFMPMIAGTGTITATYVADKAKTDVTGTITIVPGALDRLEWSVSGMDAVDNTTGAATPDGVVDSYLNKERGDCLDFTIEAKDKYGNIMAYTGGAGTLAPSTIYITKDGGGSGTYQLYQGHSCSGGSEVLFSTIDWSNNSTKARYLFSVKLKSHSGFVLTVSDSNSATSERFASKLITTKPMVAMGGNHACGYIGGVLYCWGGNVSGQLGNIFNYATGVAVQRFLPVSTATGFDPKNVSQLALGGDHSCAIYDSDMDGVGPVFCWGLDNDGQLGNAGRNTNSSVPLQVAENQSFGASIKYIASGLNHVCAINGSNKLYCWGDNSSKQLGDVAAGDKDKPTEADGTNEYLKVSASEFNTCAIRTDGDLYCWGDNSAGQLGYAEPTTDDKDPHKIIFPADPDITEVSVGAGHVCAIASTNNLYCWGNNNFGQLGINDTSVYYTHEKKEVAFSNPKSVSTGVNWTCATNTSDEIYCWGHNGSGQLGIQATSPATSVLVPDEIESLSGVTNLTSAIGSICALVNNKILCWGSGARSQLGNFSSSTHVPAPIAQIQNIATGNSHTCAQISGNFKCWGSDDYGQLPGSSTDPTLFQNSFLNSTNLTASIAVGNDHTCVIIWNQLYCYGKNDLYQVGKPSPVLDSQAVYKSANSLNASYLTSASEHTCAIMSSHIGWFPVNKYITCWGNNGSGELGVSELSAKLFSDSADRRVASGGTTLSFVINASTGSNFSCAINGANIGATAGNLYCWGGNSYGQLGLGTQSTSALPTQVPGLANVSRVSSASILSCAIANTVAGEGDLYCWGYNNYGQILGATDSIVTSPQLVIDSGKVSQVAVGEGFVCAIDDDQLKCWGSNANGRLGDGSIQNSANAVKILSPGDATLPDRLRDRVCVFVESTLMCWGANGTGQIIPGADINLPSPRVLPQ